MIAEIRRLAVSKIRHHLRHLRAVGMIEEIRRAEGLANRRAIRFRRLAVSRIRHHLRPLRVTAMIEEIPRAGGQVNRSATRPGHEMARGTAPVREWADHNLHT